MRQLPLKFILISCVLLVVCITAEEDYFPQWRNRTWDEARSYCQVCFKELVTLTPDNIQNISRKHNLTSDFWVGLRKNFNSTRNSSMPWSRWANGDPLIFQNWYPGWPMFESSLPKRYCCSCPATTTPPIKSFTGFTTEDVTSFSGLGEDTTGNTTIISSFTDVTDHTATDSTHFSEPFTQNTQPTTAAPVMTTQPPVEAGCVPIDDPETDVNYIEDSCVAMLSFGAWVEKNCSELLPFICYDDRFFGQVNVTNRTSESAILTWLPGPGNISHYRVEVRANNEVRQFQTDDLTYDLVNLTAGTRHSVQVFPVKCERDLNPPEDTFYTTPNKVENLKATSVTETSVHLSWSKPAGNVDFYLIEVQGGEQFQSNTQDKEVGNLIPGNCYTFTVLAGVNDSSTWSEESNITKYTKPGKVSDLRVSENTEDSLLLTWVQPEGNNTGFNVKAMNDSNDILFNEIVNQTKKTVTNLPVGTKITLSVTALTNGTSLEGDCVTVVNYTAPQGITDLVFDSTHNSITARWRSPKGNPSSFTVKLQLDGKTVNTTDNIKEPQVCFNGLKTAANYTVLVYTFSGHIKGPPVESSTFTKPLPPTKVEVLETKKNQITFGWKAPDNAETVTYDVKINSSFWGHSWSERLVNKTSHTFGGLKSGTRYDFEVKTVADEECSTPATMSHFTETEKREITLSMLCSSASSLLCDQSTTRESVFNELQAHFNELLGNRIDWELKQQETENKETQEM